MASKHRILAEPSRTAIEQRFWDETAIALAPICAGMDGKQGCAHLVREIADALLIERRRSQAGEVKHARGE